MSVTAKIRRQGGAAIVTIPSPLLRLMGVEIGSELALTVAEGELVARPLKAPRRRYSLAELLEGSEALERLNAETSWARDGDPVGREIG